MPLMEQLSWILGSTEIFRHMNKIAKMMLPWMTSIHICNFSHSNSSMFHSRLSSRLLEPHASVRLPKIVKEEYKDPKAR
ncbi:hypothetical protein Y032_0293g1608 [Ancylostoma ceylanicum]|uniref:Uncharacterized protein n=1 Tax=Ancylostoma ceylanicum TaxID=53326 RepID=A0A016S4X7_9BILA|nr:hypothetical protein Y032_0293g1608 [Ancylostoma ceylanicum]